MKKYSPQEKCAKCGDADPRLKHEVTFKELPMTDLDRHMGRRPTKLVDHLALTCRACGYIWDCLPLDHQEEQP